MRSVVTGMLVPTLNGVFVLGEQAEAETIEDALAALQATGLPFCLQTRPAWSAKAARVAAAHGLERFDDVPLMVLASPVAADPPPALSIRRLAPDEALLHCQIAGEAFGASPELFAQLMTPTVMGLAGLRAYLGEVGGQPAVTALSITIGEAVGIFNVATPDKHRRRGYGAALTAHAVAEGLAAGASWAWLQSSPAGYGVYERLGFLTLERWPCWISVQLRS